MGTNCELQVDISDYLPTPIACSTLINEILKCLIYQKCQIPYPYNWLRSTINRRRKRELETINDESEVNCRKPSNVTVENHFRIASKLYDTLEEAMRELSRELSNSESDIDQVVILFGPTPLCPKEVCTIQVPRLVHGHFEDFHFKEAIKHQYKAVRQVFLSELWMTSLDSTIPCSNIYIFLRKRNEQTSEMKLFKACKPLHFQKNVKQYTIRLNWKVSEENVCCNNFEIYNESSESHNKCPQVERDVSECGDNFWYQFDSCLQGFKNCFINKRSASDLW